MERSPAFSLNKEDFKKFIKGMAIAMGGAALTYLAAQLNLLNTTPEAPLWVAILSSLINLLQLWLRGQTAKPNQ